MCILHRKNFDIFHIKDLYKFNKNNNEENKVTLSHFINNNFVAILLKL